MTWLPWDSSYFGQYTWLHTSWQSRPSMIELNTASILLYSLFIPKSHNVTLQHVPSRSCNMFFPNGALSLAGHAITPVNWTAIPNLFKVHSGSQQTAREDYLVWTRCWMGWIDWEPWHPNFSSALKTRSRSLWFVPFIDQDFKKLPLTDSLSPKATTLWWFHLEHNNSIATKRASISSSWMTVTWPSSLICFMR